ncbi:MAG TPA: ABC transporter substrate-binding protein [Thermoplasmata archaeon]|nr:ABC transporter substrate-binding protein [Thermoplasmata archaeon]
MAWFLVGVLLSAGVGVGASAAYVALRPGGGGSAGPHTLTLTDDLGRNETVPYDPARVAVLSPSILDEMFRLGLRSHVVGVDCYAPTLGGLSTDYSPDQVALWSLSSAMCVEVGPSFDVETLLNLTPQLVLASTIVSVSAVQEISSTYHIPVVMLQPPTLSGILIDDSLLGRIFGVGGGAAEVNARLTGELANASNLPNTVASFPTVLLTYSTDSNGYWTFGPGTFGQSLIELAGASSIGANATLPYPELAPEQVLADQPDRIVYATGYGLNLSSYQSAPLWSSLSAVQHGNLSGIDSNWVTEPDPTMILEGLPALIALFHPGGS